MAYAGSATQRYTVYVGGQQVAAQAGSVTFDRTIGKRATANFTVHGSNSIHFQEDQQVAIYDQTGFLAFSGYIKTPQEQVPGYQPSLNTQITCCDQHRLADKRVIAATYVNKTCGFIVQDIVNTILSQEGVTVGMIYDGVTPSTTLYPSPTLYPGGNVGLIPKATFFYCSVAAALDALATAASAAGIPYYWMIDQNKKIWFVPYTAITNGTLVDGTQIDLVNSPPTVTRSNPKYRNTQYIIGGVAQTVQQTEIRVGDGNTQSWAMGYDLASAPTISVNTGSGYVAQTVGIKGTTGSQFYWAQGSPTITQDSAQTKLRGSPNNDMLQVVYIGQYPSVIITTNDAQVAYSAGLAGDSGIVEEVETDNTLTSVSNGLVSASQLLTLYAQQGTILVFDTLVSGYAPGQLIPVNLPMHGLNNVQMLISEVSASDQKDGLNIWYTVTAVVGPYDISWVQFFSKVLVQQQIANSINVGVTSSTSLLASFTATLSPSATLTGTVFTSLLPGLTRYPGTTVYPA